MRSLKFLILFADALRKSTKSDHKPITGITVINLCGRAEDEVRPEKHEKRKQVVSSPNSNPLEFTYYNKIKF